MALAAPSAMARVPLARRGLAGGVIFTGVGLGIASSGTLVPLLLRQGLTTTWLGLGLLSLVLTLAAWRGWPAPEQPLFPAAGVAAPALPGAARWGLLALCAAYGLDAAGLVPHMVFLVDFVARGLGPGVDAGRAFLDRLRRRRAVRAR